MRPNLITRLKEEWNNLDPVDPLRGLLSDAIDALTEQPAQQQEPAAVARVDDLERGGRVRALAMGLGLDAPLYTTPPQRKPLTDEQIGMAFRKAFPVGGVVFTNGAIDFARNIEAAHGIKGDE